MPENIQYSVKQTGTDQYSVLGADETVIAVFTAQSDAYDYRLWKSQTDDQKLDSALSVIRRDYWQDTRDTAESIQSELEGRIKDQEYGESLREWLIEHIDETVDGSARVIYTQSAMLGVFASDNDGAYFDEFGDEGIVEDGSINWSRLCYSAFRADVIHQLEAIGVDVNSPVPDCDDCGSDDQDTERYQIDDQWLCEDCKDAKTETAEDDQDQDEDEDQEPKTAE
jgi:hypothetical protein